MAQSVISHEEAAELKRLYDDHAAASQAAAAAILKHGMGSHEFAAADSRAGAAWRRIRGLLGESGPHWSA